MNKDLPSNLDKIQLPKHLPPVVLLPFIRPNFLDEVLKSLTQQSLLPSQILAFIDGPRTVADIPLINQNINLLKKYSETIPIKIVKRSNNLGTVQNSISAFREVFKSHSALIYLEDDVVPNYFFYDRMCRLLEAYSSHKKVFSVSSYANVPQGLEKIIDKDFMVSNRILPWGFGLWADRWLDLDKRKCLTPKYNPFGRYYNIPATIQTKIILYNQFYQETKISKKEDFAVTLNIIALFNNQVHITPMTSFVKIISVQHSQTDLLKKSESSWINAAYSSSKGPPTTLPLKLDPLPEMTTLIRGTELAQYLLKSRHFWLSPKALWHFLLKYRDINSQLYFSKLFFSRLPIILRRLRRGLSI